MPVPIWEKSVVDPDSPVLSACAVFDDVSSIVSSSSVRGIGSHESLRPQGLKRMYASCIYLLASVPFTCIPDL